jgi:GNAT superfamily N-acetyltransferase
VNTPSTYCSEIARRGDGDGLHPQAAGGRVAGVREQAALDLGLPAVQLLERAQRHVDLAAHLEHRRRLLAEQLLRHVADRAHVGGDVLADSPVSACRAVHELTVLVEQRHREAVHLRLGDVADRPDQRALDALAPRDQLVVRERVVERHHGDAVLDGRERRLRRRTGTLCR